MGNGGDARVGAALARQGIGRIVASEEQGFVLSRGSPSIPPAGEEGVDLPLLFDEGKILAWALEPRAMRRRGAACVTPSGHIVFALATSESDEPNALALLRVGCKRAVALDRGSHQPTFLHRTGAGAAPLGRYGESVLYALGRPLAPRTFRWMPPQ
jgi:hypothetical protein